MYKQPITIKEALGDQFKDFISFCEISGKVYSSELNNVDYVAFRTRSGTSREYIKSIRLAIEEAVLSETGNSNNSISQNEEVVLDEVSNSNSLETSTEDTTTDLVDSALDECQEGSERNASLSQDPNIETISTYQDITNNQSKSTGVLIPQQEKNSYIEKTSNLAELVSTSGKSSLAELFNVDVENFSGVSISCLELSIRPTNRLLGARIITIDSLLGKTINELQTIHNMGIKTLIEILENTKNYVTDPKNIIANNNFAIENDAIFEPQDSIKMDDSYKSKVEAMLLGEHYSTEGFSEEQFLHFEKQKKAAEIIGEEICLNTLINPEYGSQIGAMLLDFSRPFLERNYLVDTVDSIIKKLSDSFRCLRVIPFIQVYSKKHNYRQPNIIDLYYKIDPRIKDIPLLYKTLSVSMNWEQLTIDVIAFLNWLNFDIHQLTTKILHDLQGFFTHRGERAFDVFNLRMRGETLESVASLYGITGERIRQIEKKVHYAFWRLYEKPDHDIILLISALRNGDNTLYYDEVKSIVGEEFATILWYCLRSKSEHEYYYYSKVFDAVIIKTTHTEDQSEDKLRSIVNSFISALPDIIEDSQKEYVISKLIPECNAPAEILDNAFNAEYQHSGKFYHKKRLTVSYMCDYVLLNRFQNGYKTADSFEASRFKQYLIEFFGDSAKSITNKALDAKVGTIGVLCDRGKYIHKDYLQVDQCVIDAINDYVDQSPRSLLPYGEIFEALKGIFEGTQITNRYLLQGALKKYGCRFSTGRDFVRKSQSVTMVDELETFVEERGVVHKSEILAEFTSLGEAGLGQVSARSENVFNIENGYYIHASLFDIQPEDYINLRKYLTDACKNIPINIRTVQNTIISRFPEFINRNDFDDRNKLYAALCYMFRGEFNFSRPYIAKLGAGDVTNRSVILQHIEDFDSIDIDELIDICDENNIRYISSFCLCQSVYPEFIRINKTTLLRKELTGITNEITDQAIHIINDMLTANDYVVGSRITDFLWFPQIEIDWNEFLLESLVTQSGNINIVYLIGDPLKHPNVAYVSDKYKNDTFNSLLIKILSEKVRKGMFMSKTEMRDWLKEEGFIDGKLPKFLESTKYFYVNETGVHCTVDE